MKGKSLWSTEHEMRSCVHACVCVCGAQIIEIGTLFLLACIYK